MSLQPTASLSEILLHCSYPFEPTLEFEKPGVGEPARYGSAFHELLAWMLDFDLKLPGGKIKISAMAYNKKVDAVVARWKLPPSSVRDLPGHVKSSYGVLRNWLAGKNDWAIDFSKTDDLKVEQAVAVNVVTGAARFVEMPDVESHIYPDVGADEIVGTADIIGNVLVLDHKTGNGDFSQPAEMAQLRTLGAATRISRSGGAAIAAVLHADRRGLPAIYADEIPPPVMTSHVASLRSSITRIGDGSLNPGAWCKYCPAREICPAQYGQLVPTVNGLVEAAGGVILKDVGPLAMPVQIGRAHQLRAEMQKLLDKLSDEIKTWMKDHPDEMVTRPDGKVLEFKTKTVERISKKSIIEALGAVGAEKEFKRLRELGCLTSNEQEELHAVRD